MRNSKGGQLNVRLSLSLAGLAVLIAFILAGTAFARQAIHPDQPAAVGTMRALVDHYRAVTWTYERVARRRKTPSSFLDRRSTDRAYLQWSVATWMRRAYVAQRRALTAIHRRLQVDLPPLPKLHAALFTRVSYSRRLTLRLRSLYPGHITRSFASAKAGTGTETLRLWQRRGALAALAVAQHEADGAVIPGWLSDAFQCIHRFEGSWSSNTGNGYYGGLQMDLAFQGLYGAEYESRWGTADNWPVWAQLRAAARAYQSGRGFAPWPNTARFCGLL
jgi:hypothetical protein